MAQTTTASDDTAETARVQPLTAEDLGSLVDRYQLEIETVRNERDNALRAFGDSQKQLAATQVRAEIGTWEYWIGANRVYLSDQSYRIIGYEPGEIDPSFENLRQMIHVDDRLRVVRAFQASERFNRGATLVFRVCRKNGDTRLIRCEYVMTEDPSGQPWRMMGVLHDVTERTASASSSPARTHIAATAEYCPFILAYCDLDGTIRFANRALIEEVPSVEIGRPVFDYLTDKADAVRSVMNSVRKTQRPIRFDFENVSLAGERRKYDAWIGPVIRDNEVQGYVFSILGPFVSKTDDTETILASDAHIVSHPQRIADIGYWSRNLDTEHHQWSPRLFQIFGLEEDPSLPGVETLLQIMVPSDRSIIAETIQAVESDEKSFQVEYRIVRPDGEIRNILSRGEIVYNHLGQKTVIGTAQDITHQESVMSTLRAAEMKYRALFEEMRRTHEDMLRMTRKLSTIQEEERRRISLELHDDVGGLLSGLQIMLHVDENRLHNPNDPNDPFSRACAMVDEIIDRVGQLTSKLRPSSLDHLGLKATLLSHFREYEALYDMTLDVRVEVDDEMLIGENVKIAAFRITQEALTNVARHAHVQSAKVYVSQKKTELEIIISDQGDGIAGRHIDAYIRGIGLDGMRERAVLLGGTLEIESEQGKGTTISARLPI